MYNSTYCVNLDDIIKNLSSDDIRVLDCLRDTSIFDGITIKDLLEEENIIDIGAKHSKIYIILERLRAITAVGIKMDGKYYCYYIKEVGRIILKYLEEN